MLTDNWQHVELTAALFREKRGRQIPPGPPVSEILVIAVVAALAWWLCRTLIEFAGRYV